MKDSTLFIVCGTVIALAVIYKAPTFDANNIITLIIGTMGGCATGFTIGKFSKNKDRTNG